MLPVLAGIGFSPSRIKCMYQQIYINVDNGGVCVCVYVCVSKVYIALLFIF